MRLFLSVVLAILGVVLASYAVEGWRAGQVQVSPRLARGETRVITRAREPATYWTHMAIVGGTAAFALGMAVRHGRGLLRERRKKG